MAMRMTTGRGRRDEAPKTEATTTEASGGRWDEASTMEVTTVTTGKRRSEAARKRRNQGKSRKWHERKVRVV